jgi:ABC-type sugar transport system substrate-binding protein
MLSRKRVFRAALAATAAGVAAAVLVSLGGAAVATAKSPVKLAIVYQVAVPAVEIEGAGAAVAAKQFGFNIHELGPTAYNVLQQETMSNSEANSGAQGIGEILVNSSAWGRTISNLQSRGVKVVDNGVYTGPFLGAKTPIYVGPDDHAYGAALSKLLIGALGPKAHGNVVITWCAPGVQELEERVSGVKTALAKAEPGVKLLGPFMQTDSYTQGVLDAQRIVLANPHALAFVGLCSTAPGNFAQVKAKDHGKWLITGGELDPRNLQGIKKGLVTGVVDASLWLDGYITARLLYLQVTHPTTTPTTGWIDSTIETVTKSNIDAVIKRQSSLANQASFYTPIVNKIFANLKANVKPLSASQVQP